MIARKQITILEIITTLLACLIGFMIISNIDKWIKNMNENQICTASIFFMMGFSLGLIIAVLIMLRIIKKENDRHNK